MLTTLTTLAMGACHRVLLTSQAGSRPVVWFMPSGGCHPETMATTPSLPPQRASDTLSRAFALSQGVPPQRDAWLARRVPGGYGGGPYPQGNDPSWAIHLRDTTQKLTALATLDSLDVPDLRDQIPPEFRPLPQAIGVRAVRWDAAELYDWLKYSEARLSETGGIAVNGWGVHSPGNHVLLYLEKVESLAPLLEQLERYHVPCYLVKIGVVGPLTIA